VTLAEVAHRFRGLFETNARDLRGLSAGNSIAHGFEAIAHRRFNSTKPETE
jgi:hypothetical protein